MARYGYARVSSTDQDCALQEARLRAEGCKVIRTEKASGKSRDGRDELARIMDFLHAGDELVTVVLAPTLLAARAANLPNLLSGHVPRESHCAIMPCDPRR